MNAYSPASRLSTVYWESIKNGGAVQFHTEGPLAAFLSRRTAKWGSRYNGAKNAVSSKQLLINTVIWCPNKRMYSAIPRPAGIQPTGLGVVFRSYSRATPHKVVGYEAG